MKNTFEEKLGFVLIWAALIGSIFLALTLYAPTPEDLEACRKARGWTIERCREELS